MQDIRTDGAELIVSAHGASERYACRSPEEATARARFITEALSWVGTPFRDLGDVKGPKGCVDCAMLMTRCAVDTGMIAPFDPRPYPPRWMLKRDAEERFLAFLTHRLGMRETATPIPGDIHVYQWAWTYSHGAIRINAQEIVHAFAAIGRCIISRIDEPLLTNNPLGHVSAPRPVKYFDLWSRSA